MRTMKTRTLGEFALAERYRVANVIALGLWY